MNNRSLTRGDAAVLVAAVVLFIASFLDFFTAKGSRGEGYNGWSNFWFPALPSIFLAGFIAAGLIVGSRFLKPQQQTVDYAGLRLDQWGIALSVFAAWSALWTLFANPVGLVEGLNTGAGQILGLISALVLAASAVLTTFVPALKLPLVNASPAHPGMAGQPYGAQPGQPQPGYGYPGGQPGGQQPYGAQPGQPQQPAQSAPQGAQPQPGADPNFQPYWFAVPAARPLYGEDGSPTPVAELAPGTWYLAVEQRGQTLVAQTQDGRRGVLQDTTGIQRG